MRKWKYYEKLRRRIYRNFDKLFDSHCLDGKEIVLSCLIDGIQYVVDYVAAHGLKVSAFIDNAPNKIGQKFNGIRVYSPEGYLRPYRSNVAILICTANIEELASQLEEMGYRNGVDFFAINIVPRTPVPVVRMELSAIWNIAKGYMLYKRITRGRGNNCKLLLAPYPGSGDLYFIGMYLLRYIQKEQLKNYVVVVNGNLPKKTLALFDIEAEVLNSKQSYELLLAYEFLGADVVNIKLLHRMSARIKKSINLLRIGDLIHFIDIYKYNVFELNESAKAIRPIFKTTKEEVDKFFDKNGLVRGKSVILAPYIGMDRGIKIPAAVWEQLAAELSYRGYCVCTNSANDNEPPVKGTKPIFFPLCDSVPILDTAGYFIGIRSGLCDVVSSSVCKMIVLYINATILPLNIFGLKRMGLNDAAIELNYDGTDDETFVDRILQEF